MKPDAKGVYVKVFSPRTAEAATFFSVRVRPNPPEPVPEA